MSTTQVLPATECYTRLGGLCREVASHYEGDVGVQLFDWYDAINHFFFEKRLPQAFLLTSITPYGRCVGLTKSSIEKLPLILIHCSERLTEQEKFYIVLHEAIHVHVRYNLRDLAAGKTSHSNEAWLQECNRIAGLLGYADITIGYNKPTREGKAVKRVQTGNVSYECSYRFPHALEQETGRALPPISTWL